MYKFLSEGRQNAIGRFESREAKPMCHAAFAQVVLPPVACAWCSSLKIPAFKAGTDSCAHDIRMPVDDCA